MAQVCPSIVTPLNNATNIPVTTTIEWNDVVGINGYILSLGTTPGGTDLLDRLSVGSATTYTPPLGLPENTQIYVTITLFFFDRPNFTCSTETFETGDVTTAPPCTSLANPSNGALNINIGTNIDWNFSPTATSYRLSIATQPNLAVGDIFDQNVGNVLSYNPTVDFAPNTTIYVTVIPENENGFPAACAEESFTTGDIALLPVCASLINPTNGDINVPLTPILEWTEVPGATGYRLTIGNSPFTAEILDNATFTTNSTLVINFEPNRTFFVSITPFNDAGDAIGCQQESFSTILGCGPYIDVVTGELVTLNPEIDLPDTFSFCQNEAPLIVTSTDIADGYRWYKVDQFGNESLISDTAEVPISENGEYRYEAFNLVDQPSGIIECPTTKMFNVVSSGVATISNVDITLQNGNLRLEITATGMGDYEYALNNIEGPYQDSNIFEDVAQGSPTVYVRDKNGCGIVEQTIEQDLSLEGFPKFFTPNGDGINDRWQFIPPHATGEINVEAIHIYDRYGKLLIQINPASEGWDGTFNGLPLPASDYWFKAISTDNEEVVGHFALKR